MFVCLLAASILLCYWRHKVLCKRRRTEPPSPAKPAHRPKLEPSNNRAPSLQQWLTDSLKDLKISRDSPSDVLNVHFDDGDQRPGIALISRPALHSSVMAAPYACLPQQEKQDLLLQTMLFVISECRLCAADQRWQLQVICCLPANVLWGEQEQKVLCQSPILRLVSCPALMPTILACLCILLQ